MVNIIVKNTRNFATSINGLVGIKLRIAQANCKTEYGDCCRDCSATSTEFAGSTMPCKVIVCELNSVVDFHASPYRCIFFFNRKPFVNQLHNRLDIFTIEKHRGSGTLPHTSSFADVASRSVLARGLARCGDPVDNVCRSRQNRRRLDTLSSKKDPGVTFFYLMDARTLNTCTETQNTRTNKNTRRTNTKKGLPHADPGRALGTGLPPTPPTPPRLFWRRLQNPRTWTAVCVRTFRLVWLAVVSFDYSFSVFQFLYSFLQPPRHYRSCFFEAFSAFFFPRWASDEGHVL